MGPADILSAAVWHSGLQTRWAHRPKSLCSGGNLLRFASWLWHRKIFSKSVTSWRFNGAMAANRISTLSYSVARVRAQLAVGNRMCSEMFCDRRSGIPTPAFSSTVSSSSAVTHCNRAGTMDTTLGFTASNICGAYRRARHRDNNQQAILYLGWRDALCRVPNIWDMTTHVPPVTSESLRAKAMCLRHEDGSIDPVTKPARERNHPA